VFEQKNEFFRQEQGRQKNNHRNILNILKIIFLYDAFIDEKDLFRSEPIIMSVPTFTHRNFLAP